MPDIALTRLDELISAGEPAVGFDLLIGEFLAAGEYGMAFEARLMKRRFELGLPLIQSDAPERDSPEQADYQASMVAAARETGELFLAAGNIERAWPYFRAIHETAPVAEAIEKLEPGEGQEGVIAIAFQEGLHPVKGLELILATHGMCRALTAFGMTVVTKDRERCIGLLTSALHGEVVERIGQVIAAREGAVPESRSLVELIAGREWLFGEWDYYVDTSHLITIIPYCAEVSDAAALRLMHELCVYGQHLNERFHSPGNPPFEKQFEAWDRYALALLGEDADTHLAYFRAKLNELDPEMVGDAPGRFLVKLLVSLKRPAEALDVLIEHVFENAPYGVPVPSALQLCYETHDFGRMAGIAQERGDALSYAAARILAVSCEPEGTGDRHNSHR